MRKGQVTIFIILGILILLFVALFFVFTSFDLAQQDTEKQAAVHARIQQCVEDSAIHGLRLLSAKGGYYHIPENFVVYAQENSFIQSYYPYYYKNKKLLAPDIDTLEQQFEYYLLATAKDCYSNTTETLQELGEHTAEVSISENEIEIIYDPNMLLVEEKSTTTIQEIELTIPSTYYQAYSAALQLAAEQNTEDNTFCLSCLQKYKSEIIQNIIIQEIALEPNYIILYAINYTEQARGEIGLFMFAGQYALSERETSFALLPIADQNVTIGYPFTYQVQTTGTATVFRDSSDLFTIGATGLISFYPDEAAVGTHLIEIEAEDAEGHTDNTLFLLDIFSPSEAPTIDYIGYQQAVVGEEFMFNVTATHPDSQYLYYTEDTDLFEIGLLDGTISFIPTEDQQGTYTITISVITDKGASATELLYLIIT